MLGIYQIHLWTYTIPKCTIPTAQAEISKAPRRMTKLSNFSLRSRSCPLPPAEKHAAAWIHQWHYPCDLLAIWTHDLIEITVASMTSNFYGRSAQKLNYACRCNTYINLHIFKYFKYYIYLINIQYEK